MKMLDLLDRYFIKQPRLRRWVTRLMEGECERDVELLGALVRVHSVKEHGYLRASRLIARSSLLRDEVPVLINLAALFRDGDSFLDIGANVGVFSLSLVRLCRIFPRLRFYAFEAHPDTFARLELRAAEAGIRAFNFALSDREGSLEFVGGAVSNVFTTSENACAYSIRDERLVVPCRRLDQLPIEGHSLILKIDVEGQEQNVLEGAGGCSRLEG